MRSVFRSRRDFAQSCLLALVAIAAMLPAYGASVQIDLDGDPSNGAESTVETKVLQSFPVKIENVVTNNTSGISFTFDWLGAGPGGFSSILTPGPDVGTKWAWSTVSQVYSISGAGSFVEEAPGLPVFGSPPGGFVSPGGGARDFTLPGKSIFPNQATASTASLTSSLITFFSPENTVATCESSFTPGVFTQTITNTSGEDLRLLVEQEDCCLEPNQIICGEICRSYLVDDTNCGDCGVTCAFDEFCDDGACAPICPGVGEELCDGECVDTLNDDTNCGGCGITCVHDEFCDGGECAPICPGEGEEFCGGECADTLNDDTNCGGCGVVCVYDEFCDGGACGPICPGDGQAYCDGECADTLNDVANCGDCGITCAVDEFCSTGVCAPICPGEGQEYCDGVCADTLNDDTNCGGCGVTCAYDEVCEAGACTLVCPPGLSFCGETCIDLLNDPGNCGACGILCGSNEVCENATCATCLPDQTVCDNTCKSIFEDPDNCGGCGIECLYYEFCDGGSCAPICSGEGQEYCNGECADTLNDPMNCGDCDIVCPEDEVCEAGVCTSVCPPGLSECGETCVDLFNDPANCGACGILCGSNEVCENATCSTCLPHETVCGNTCTSIFEDPDNCGGCGNVCDFSNCPTGTIGACGEGSCVCIPEDNNSGDPDAPAFTFDPIRTDPPDTVVRVPALRQRPASTVALSLTPPQSLPGPRREGLSTAKLPATRSRPVAPSRRVSVATTVPVTQPQSLLTPQHAPTSVVTRPVVLPPQARPDRAQQAPIMQPSRTSRTRARGILRGPAERYLAREELRLSTAGEERKSKQPRVPRASVASPTVEEAPVCEFQEPIEQIIPDGESYIQCQTGALLGTEVFTRASVVRDGELVGVGPCAVFVPAPEIVVDDFYATTTAVLIDDASRDGLLQPGEQADLHVTLLNVGPLELMNPVATLSGPPDQFNPLEITTLVDTAFFPDFPAFQNVADCETPPVLEPKKALSAFTIVVPEEHDPDVGRALRLVVNGDNIGPVSFEMPLIIGIGEKCDVTELNGETYDGLNGLLPPLDVELVPSGIPVNYSITGFGKGSLIPLRVQLRCGTHTLTGQEIDPKPRIVSIVHETLGPLSLDLINVGEGPFPVIPVFHCNALQCQYIMNSTNLPVGTYVIGIEMPDTRVFEAGFTLVDFVVPSDG